MAPLVPEIITGMPAGFKSVPRADFIPSEFDQAITTKGYRMFWSRAGICPCTNNDQTEQPDPTCELCKGDSYYYFQPDAAVAAGAVKDSQGNEIVVNNVGDGVQIYVLMTALTQDVEVFEKFGEWVMGTGRATTQSPNKLSYRDRLVSIESWMSWAQTIDYEGGEFIPVVGERKKTGLRYPFLTVNQLRSVKSVFRLNVDFELTPQGTLKWLANAPNPKTRLSIHGTINPVWIVMENPHSYRDSFLEGGTASLKAQKLARLPVQSMVKLDFLVNP